ncbi:MAG: hypothetical protein QOH06_3980 [Acidobacteriota bacterium]|nr:hypothetical protein [Acidobacteriota bacterium]
MPSGPLAADLREVLARMTEDFDRLDPSRREPLLAWLKAWKHHWPERFEQTLGWDGERCLAKLATTATDPNRYLKLRRIAVENLSHLL